MNNTVIYDKSLAYAKEHGELESYYKSQHTNKECAKAIDKAIRENYSYESYSLDSTAALKAVKEAFTIERIAVVTAINIRENDWDERIAKNNKAWAKTIPYPKDLDDWGRDRNADCVINAHKGLLNLFADDVRKDLDLTKTVPMKKASLVDKLNRPLPKQEHKTSKNKGQELS